MKVRVERCWGGGNRYSFRLTLPSGAREHITGEKWDRAASIRARDLIEYNYGVTRSRIRFAHH